MEIRDLVDTPYNRALKNYLDNGIGWEAECFKNTNQDDMEQFAADSFHAGWVAHHNESAPKPAPKQPQTLVQELTQVINRRSLENGSNTPDFILADFLSRCLVAFDDTTNARATWYGQPMKDLEFNKVAGACVTPEENKAAQLRALHKTPYGANLGINAPEIVAGLRFKTTHSPALVFEIASVNPYLNEITIRYQAENGSPYMDVWELGETRERFERGDYWQVFDKQTINQAAEAIGDYYKTRSHWDAEALLKRQFPHGGVYEKSADFEARKQASKPITDGMADRIIEKRKEAGRQIMEDIEKQTADTLHGFKKSFAYVPTDLLEEFNRTNAALAKMWDEGQRTTQEYKDLQKKANELAETMNKVKKEAIEKEAGDKMARIVADAMQVTDAFVKASKAIQVFNKEAREADAIRKKMEHMEPKTGNGAQARKKPITDNKGFLFIAGNGEILWALHDGQKYCFCNWEDSAWVGWRVSEADVIEAGHTQLPLFLDDFVRSICPTN